MAELAEAYPKSPLILVAPERYLHALQGDLTVAAGTKTLGKLDRLLVPCDARLRPLVGGGRRTLNIQVARKIVSEAGSVPRLVDNLQIQNIVDYLNGENTLFPNSIILALSCGRGSIKAAARPWMTAWRRPARWRFPLPNGRQKKPAWIVDGQQRAVALSKCNNPNDGICKLLVTYWTAVSRVFPEAWGKPRSSSRLMHGAGVVSLGFVMDAIADRHGKVERLTVKQFREDIEPLPEICRWTNGYWDFGPGAQLKWNEIQNTPRHVQMLANYLLVQYKARVWNRADRKGKA